MGRGKSNVNMVRTARRTGGGRAGRILYNAWDNNRTAQTAPEQDYCGHPASTRKKLQERLNSAAVTHERKH
jgi:hypothetical protein